MEKTTFPSWITSASSFDPDKPEQMKMEQFNREYKAATDYDCPKCGNKELIAFRREDGQGGRPARNIKNTPGG